jgi:4-amino-4-deoxy-L-arabinose transferase-like glycosyltransferase
MQARLAWNSPHAVLLAAVAYFALNAATQGLVSPTADLDQAEQLVLSQDLALGYGEQPPLYSWIVHGLFSLTGPSLWALRGIKVALLTALIYGAYLVSRRLGLDGARLGAALLGFALIPQLAWEAQRDLTHSVLATVLSMWTLWAFLALRPGPGNLRGYLVLGLLVGLGLLSKYNYVVFTAALFLAALASPGHRARVLHPGILLSALAAAVVVLPHLGWALAHPQLAVEDTLREAGVPRWTGLADLGQATLAFLAPLLLVAGLSWRRWAEGDRPSGDLAFLWTLCASVLVLLVLFVLVSGAENVKDRWLQPLLFFMPIAVASMARVRPRALIAASLVLWAAAALLLPGRTLLSEWTGKVSRPNLPYAKIADGLRGEIRQPGLIVSDSQLVAGNMRLAFPASRVEVARTPEALRALLSTARGREILFLTEEGTKNAWFADLVVATAQPGGAFRAIERPLLHAPDRTLRLHWLMIQEPLKRNTTS